MNLWVKLVAEIMSRQICCYGNYVSRILIAPSQPSRSRISLVEKPRHIALAGDSLGGTDFLTGKHGWGIR